MSTIETRRIADQLSRAVEGSAWHGPALLQLLEGIPAAAASATPVAGAHSIWEITLHVGAWLDFARQRLEREAPAPITPDMDWPPVADTSPASWTSTVARVRAAGERLQATIAAMPDERLGDELPGVDDTWSAYHTLHGVVQHVLYHAGQIAILKRGVRG